MKMIFELEEGALYRVNLTELTGMLYEGNSRGKYAHIPLDSLFLILKLNSCKFSDMSEKYWDLILTFNDKYPDGVKLHAPLRIGYQVTDFTKVTDT